MTDKIVVYGTLMAGFDRRRRAGIDTRMTFLGRGWIAWWHSFRISGA